MTGKIAAVGNGDCITVLRSAGVDAFPAEDEKKARDVLRKIAADYAVIFLDESYAVSLAGFLKRFDEQPYPVVLPIPAAGGSAGYGEKFLRETCERALGVDILFK